MCLKYNYSLDKRYQKQDHYAATLRLSSDGEQFIIHNFKPTVFSERYQKIKSNSTCFIRDIQSFVFGGFSSRFWVYRKHINSMNVEQLRNLPFYSWECLTLNTEHKSINLVIKDEKQMDRLVEFLIVQL